MSLTVGVSGSKIAGYPEAEQPIIVGRHPEDYRYASGPAVRLPYVQLIEV